MSRPPRPAPAERRAAPRSKSAISAYLVTHTGDQLRGVAKSLSRSGVFVELKLPVEWLVGESGRLFFSLKDGNVIRLACYPVLVVREARNGVGVAFWRSGRSPRHERRF